MITRLPIHFGTSALLSMAASLPLHAESATSTPCGYIQTDLYAKSTCYLGLGVQPEALMQHTLKADNVTRSGNKVTITDFDVNFNDLMDSQFAYVLEFIFKDEIVAVPVNRNAWKTPSTCWTEHSLTVDDKSLSELVRNTTPDFYILRKARTVNDVLGTDNTFGLKEGTSGTADSVAVFETPTTKLTITFSNTQGGWVRRGSREDMGVMPVFNHEPLTIIRKDGANIRPFIIGEVSSRNQKILLSQTSTLLHTGLPMPQTLQDTALKDALPNHGSDIVYLPIGKKNEQVPCIYNNTWQRRDTGEDVSNVPFDGAVSILSASKVPSHVTVQSNIPSSTPQS